MPKQTRGEQFEALEPRVNVLLRRTAELDGARNASADLVSSSTDRLIKLRQQTDKIEKATVVINEVAILTQNKLRDRLADLCNTALAAVFDKLYKVTMELITSRGRSEANVVLQTDHAKGSDILDWSGGGIADVVSFALRMALWSLRESRSSVIVLDEPFKNVSRDAQAKASSLIKYMAEQLGVQFIVVSHEEELIAHADKVFRVTQVDGRSSVVAEDQKQQSMKISRRRK